MRIGLGIAITNVRGGGEPPVITVAEGGTPPSLGPLTDGNQVQDALSAGALDAGNYASTEGTISTVTAAVTINGTTAALADAVEFDDVVSVSVLVTDSEANERNFNVGTRTVQGIAPTADTAPVISGATVGETPSVTPGTYSGTPAPTVIGAFTLDGSAFDPPTELQEADEGKTLAYNEQASNGVGDPATQSVSETVAGAFDLASVFDPTDTDNLSQTSSGIGVVGDGDPVGLLKAPGISDTFSQSSSAKRPAYETVDNGLILYDGVEDFLTLGTGTFGSTGLFADAGQQFFVAVVVKQSFNDEGTVVARATSSGDDRTFQVFFQGGVDRKRTPAFILRGGEFTEPQWELDDGNLHVVWIQWDGTTALAGYDNAPAETMSVGTASENFGQNILLGARTDGAGFLLDGRIGALTIRDEIPATVSDRNTILAELLSRHGVSL